MFFNWKKKYNPNKKSFFKRKLKYLQNKTTCLAFIASDVLVWPKLNNIFLKNNEVCFRCNRLTSRNKSKL